MTRHGQFLRGILIVCSGLLGSIFVACSDDPTEPGPPDSVNGWTKLEVSPEWVTTLALSSDHLAISGGVSGVFIQSPPIEGPIDSAGSEFPELANIDLSYGVFGLIIEDNVLYRGFRGPANHIPVECGGLESPYELMPCSAGVAPHQRINDMMALPNGDLLLGTGAAVYRKASGSSDWTEAASGTFVRTAFSRGASHVVYLAHVFSRGSTLRRSIDDGAHWSRVDTIWPQGVDPEDLLSLATTTTGDTVLASVPNGVLVSTNSGATFTTLKAVLGPGVVRLEPVLPYRCIILADSLYQSPDLGNTWFSRPLPGRPLVMFGQESTSLPMDLSWESGTLVIGRLGNDNAEVWSCQLD